MQGQTNPILALLNAANRKVIIPVYQRNYEWKLDNCAQLYDDLVKVIAENKKTHFFGSIVSFCQGRDELVLIDGQQRVTTISLIMIAIVNAIKSGACTSENETLCDQILEQYIINKYQKGERKVRLKPFRNDCEAFDRLIEKPESEYIESSKVTTNYRYFYQKITQSKDVSVDELFEALNRLQVIDIVLDTDNGDDPQLIFESLNSTGLDLTEADKIRNYVLMNLDTKTQERLYDDYWNKIEHCCGDKLDIFVRNFLVIKTAQKYTLKHIYRDFKNYTRQHPHIEPILQDMLRYAQAYHRIVTSQMDCKEANDIARRLEMLEQTATYPFFMALEVYAQETALDAKEIAKVYACIESFIFRRLICGSPTHALTSIFSSLHSSVVARKTPTNSYADIVVYSLRSRKGVASFPRDTEFAAAFTAKDIYAMNRKNKTYIFERLENGHSKERHDIYTQMENGTLSIEHIMPQKLNSQWKQALGDNWEQIHEQWLHTIANLTLTGYNANYGNKPFAEKKTIKNGYAESHLHLNTYLAKLPNWTETELAQRSQHLAQEARTIWPYPTTDYVIPEDSETYTLEENEETFTSQDITHYEFMSEKRNVKKWTTMYTNVLQTLLPLYPEVRTYLLTELKAWFTPAAIDRTCAPIANNLFAITASSTSQKITLLKRIFAQLHLDESELVFGLKTHNPEPDLFSLAEKEDTPPA